MANPNINQRLNGLEPLSYAGVNAVQPPDFVTKPRDPTITDSKNVYLGTIWLNTTTEAVWMLVSLAGSVATWVMLTGAGGSVTTLTGNSGGPVSPILGNINVVGDATYINIVGVPGTHTLTASLINGGTFANSFITNPATGTAVPVAGVLTFAGSTGLVPSAAGSTVTYTLGGSVAQSFPTDFTSPAAPALGVLNVFGGTSADAEQVALVYRKNIHTAAVTNTVFVKLNESMSFPATNAAGTAGIIYSGGVAAGNKFLHNFGTGNVFLGLDSGNLTLTGTNNTVVGVTAAKALTSGSANTYLGVNAGTATTTGSDNDAIGVNTLDSLTTGGSNSAVGNAALTEVTTGSNNVAIGRFAGSGLTTGNNNVFIGVTAGNTLLTGSSNLILGTANGSTYVGAESSNILLGSNGVVGESNVMRLGTTGTTAKSFIVAVRGVTTDINDAVPVLVDSAGQLGVTSSSARFKDNIEDVGSDSNILQKLRPVVFNYKKHAPEHKNYGLIAEEVAILAPRLVVYDKDGIPETVRYDQVLPLLLNEFQKHCKLIGELQAINTELLNRIRLLEESNFKCH